MSEEASRMTFPGRVLVLLYSVSGYLAFLGVFVYFILWSVGALVPHTVDSPPLLFEVNLPIQAVVVNLGLIALFGFQHSVMARPAFKDVLTAVVPKPAERATFVWMSNLALMMVILGWQPLPAKLWETSGGLEATLFALNAMAWAFAVAATGMIDHFELFGLQQAWRNLRGRMPDSPRFMTRFAYRFVRHPLMTGIVLGLWIVPTMSWGHLVLSLGFSVYVLIGTSVEEKDLIRLFGEKYRQYRRQVPRLFPRPGASVESRH